MKGEWGEERGERGDGEREVRGVEWGEGVRWEGALIYQGRNKGSSESLSSCIEGEREAGREAERGRVREREGRGREGGR